MHEPITGGTVFWLNSGIDRGDIAYQDWCFVDPKLFNMRPKEAASILWKSELQKIGLNLLSMAICDIKNGKIIKKRQDDKYSTWEPATDVNDIYRPDSLMLEYNKTV
jgi:methionyl-tRNA formyltransferase